MRIPRRRAWYSRKPATAQASTSQSCASESDKETLSRTENSQIAIFTHSMAALAALRENGVAFKAAAGFSLGEYTSLAAAGVVTLADGVKIVSKRGKLMQHAADTIDGGMAAILGLEDAKIEEACAAVKNGIVRPVNYNCPGQLVIAGEKAALAEAIENCKAAGARRALPLAVSGAFHTPLMAEAAVSFVLCLRLHLLRARLWISTPIWTVRYTIAAIFRSILSST